MAVQAVMGTELSEVDEAARPLGMTKRCEECGGCHETSACPEAYRYFGFGDDEVVRLRDGSRQVRPRPPRDEPTCALIWADDRRVVECLVSQWPFEHEFVPPQELGDSWGVRLSVTKEGLSVEPKEYEVRDWRLLALVNIGELLEQLVEV